MAKRGNGRGSTEGSGRGRRKGSRNKGYFYRAKRGWFAKDQGGKFHPLIDEQGARLREPDLPDTDVKAAYARWLVYQNENGTKQVTDSPESDITVVELCDAYLEKSANTDAPTTTEQRANTLFDFCLGVPPRFRQSKRKPKSSDRIHAGYGGRLVLDLKPLDIDRWLQAHPNWNGSKRTYLQAIKRMLNYGVESGLIPRNPLRGYKIPKQRGRVTYITPEQERAMYGNCKSAYKVALRVLIRTGARPGREFAALTAKHVYDHGDRMEWVFSADESKTRTKRVIRIRDRQVMELVRRQMRQHKGKLFRNERDQPWTVRMLSQRFRLLKKRLKRKGVELDPDACLYSCRHTYAKRLLEGFYTGKPITIETLARLMGNSPQICRDHYLQWSELHNEQLWEAC